MSTLHSISENSTFEAIKDFNFSINPALEINTIYIGNEQEPIIIVDNLLLYPDSVIDYAESGCSFKKDAKDFYPGIRKPLAPAYAENVYRHLMNTFWTVFSSNATVNIKLLSSVLSLTTTQPKELRPIQSVPHFDSFLTNNVAGVHYLCAEKFGGTSFYRHRTTGFETLNSQRIQEYAKILKAEVMQASTNTFDYINGDTTIFERIASVDAKFNRAIFYRSNILHSGNIQTSAGLSENPRTGRLTANTLIAIN